MRFVPFVIAAPTLEASAPVASQVGVVVRHHLVSLQAVVVSPLGDPYGTQALS